MHVHVRSPNRIIIVGLNHEAIVDFHLLISPLCGTLLHFPFYMNVFMLGNILVTLLNPKTLCRLQD